MQEIRPFFPVLQVHATLLHSRMEVELYGAISDKTRRHEYFNGVFGATFHRLCPAKAKHDRHTQTAGDQATGTIPENMYSLLKGADESGEGEDYGSGTEGHEQYSFKDDDMIVIQRGARMIMEVLSLQDAIAATIYTYRLSVAGKRSWLPSAWLSR